MNAKIHTPTPDTGRYLTKSYRDFSKLALGNATKYISFQPSWYCGILLTVGILSHSHFFYDLSSQGREKDIDIFSLTKLLLPALFSELLYHK